MVVFIIADFFTSKYFWFIFIALLLNMIVFYIKKRKTPINNICVCLIMETAGMVFGAKILDIVMNYGFYLYLLESKSYFRMFTAGYIFMGGAFGAVFGIFVYCMIFNEDFRELCDVLVPNLLLVYSVSKIGCFCAGCCSGIAIRGYILPIQLIESILYFSIYLFVMLRKNSSYSKIYLTCILFGIFRFSLEFLRVNTGNLWISVSQVLSIYVLILGVKVYWMER